MKHLFFKSILLFFFSIYWYTLSAQIIDGVRYSFNDNLGTAWVIEYNSNSNFNRNFYVGSITIPSTVTYNNVIYTVTGIASQAFHDCSGMTSITIPNSVTSIGSSAFHSCSALPSITIPNSVTSIGKSAFYGCSKLTSINIPYGVTSIENSTFSGCSSLSSVTIPNTVTSIGTEAFKGCVNLTDVTIPNSMKSLNEYAFRNCNSLTKVTINSNEVMSKSYTVTFSLRNIFGTQVKEFELGEGVTSIGRYAFGFLGDLTSIIIPYGLTSIGDNAIYACTQLSSIDIPSSVTSIGNQAFMRCSGLTSITIPNSVTSIGNAAFFGCSSLASFTFSNYLTSIGDSTFYECVGLTSITIPNNVTSIRSKAFYGCSSLSSVTATMTNPFTFGTSAFSGIDSTCKLFVPLGKRDAYINKGWNTSVFKGGVYAGGDLNETFTYTYKGKTLTYKVTDATNRYVQVMKCNTSVSGSVEIPSSITYFGNTFGVTSIGSSSFNGCSYVSSITIPNSVTSIGSSAFLNCNSLTSVTANMTNPFTFGTSAFSGISSTCKLFVPLGKRDAYINKGWNTSIFMGGVYAGGDLNETFTYTYNGQTLTYKVTDATNRYVQVMKCNTSVSGSVEIPSSITYFGKTFSVTSIGIQAFSGCNNLTTVVVPNSVTTIDNGVFARCSGLTSVSIPNSVTSIGSSAFYECSGLTSLTIPNSVTSIGGMAFQYCKGLTTVTLSNSLTFIGGQLFLGCSSLTSVTIPNSVTKIGERAFSGCTSLTSVTIPNSVNTIYDNAFAGCSGLSSVYINSSDAWLGISFGNMAANPLYYAHRLYTYITLDFGDDIKFEILNFTISEGVTTIRDYAFSGYSGLLSLTIPSSVTSIGEYAFYGCSGLTSITFPSSLTNIGSNAFNNCSGLSSVTANMLNPFAFGTDAFAGIGSTCSLYVPSGKRDAYINKSWDTNVFKGGVYAGGDLNETFTYTYKGKTLTYKVIDATNRYVQVVKCDKSEIGSVEIPTNITYFDKTFSVTSIGQSAFYDCSGLTSLSIPNSVGSIGDGAFTNCSGLTSITIPNGVSNINNLAFYGCSSLTSISIPNSVTRIGEAAFRGCSSLTSITIPKNVINIEGIAFEGCSSLESIVVASGNTVYDSRNNCNAIIEKATNTLILGCKRTTIPNNVASIGNYAFSKCSGLTSISIPSSVTSIGYNAFANCSGLTSISIPNSVTSIGNSAFSGCKCSVYCNSETPSSATEYTFNKDMIAIVPRNSVSKYKQATGWKIMSIQSIPSLCSLVGTTQSTITLCASNMVSNVKAVLNDVTYNSQNDIIEITGLDPYTSYTISLSGVYENLQWDDQISVTTKNISLDIELVKNTNVTLRLKGYVSDLGDAVMASSGFEGYEGQNEIYVKGLAPGRTYYFTYYIVTPSGKKLSTTESFQTVPVTLNVSATTSSSSALLTGSYSIIDATITECGFDGYPKQNPIKYTGLDPNKSYSQTFYIVTKEGGRISKSVTFTTKSLTLTTSQPKVISAGNVIVAAESNLDDEETNVGFEWRRIDYTSEFPSNTGTAYLYNGTMEGYIRSLYTEKLWKYRPYYTSDAGNSYYGEWMGIDPTNTSYFEPTVHTYANVSVNGNSAEVKGYVQRGTDNVVSKGFAYWEQSQDVKSREAMSAPSMISSLPSNAKTIEVSGSQQVMTASLSNLEYETTYCYVTFVRTSEGDTFYGEEMTFTSGESPYIMGDVNGDKEIDISDVVAMVNHILGNTSSTSFKPQAADINKDGNIDISDVVSLVNMILGQ